MEDSPYKAGSYKEQDLIVTTPDGTVTRYPMKEALSMGLNPDNLTGKTPLYTYKDAEGNTKLTTDVADVPMSIKLNTDTGNIEMSVPNSIYNSAEFAQAFDADTLKKYSQAYKLNPDYRVTVTEKNEETGEVEEKGITIPEYIEKLNDSLEQFRQSLKSIQTYRSQLYQKYGDKVKNMNLAQIQMSLQYDGDSIYFPAELLHPSKIGNKDNFFEALSDKIDENGLISVEDLKEVYTRTNIGRDEFASMVALIDGTLEGSEWGPDTYKDAETGEEIENQNSATRAAKLLAFRNFIMSNNPDSEWWQQAGDQIESFITNAAYGVTRVFGNIANVAESVITLGNGTMVQEGIKSMDDAMEYFNTNNALVYDAVANAQILGTLGGTLTGTVVAGHYIGGAISSLSAKASSFIGAKSAAAAAEAGVAGIEGAAAEAFTASTIAAIAADAENISTGARVMLNALSLADKTQLAINVASMFLLKGQIGSLFKGETALASIGNFTVEFLADTFHDALLYDSTTLRDVIISIQSSDSKNKESMVNYWLGQLADNAKFWGPMGLAQASVKMAGKTALGIAANQIATKYINKFVAAAGNRWSTIRNNLAGGNIVAKLNDQLKKAQEEGDIVKEQHLKTKIQIQNQKILLREARSSLGNLKLNWDGVKLTEESLAQFNDFLSNIKAMENALDFLRSGTQSWRRMMLDPITDPSTGRQRYLYPTLAGANVRAAEWYEDLVKLNKKYGLGLADHGSQISQDVIDYWVGSDNLRRLDWVASHNGMNAADAQTAAEIVRKDIEHLSNVLPDEITNYIDRGLKQKIYPTYYKALNEFGYSGKEKVLDKTKIDRYEQNPMWREVGYSPIKVKPEDTKIKFISDDGSYEAIITDEMNPMSFHARAGQHYEDPELVRQIRTNHMAEAKNNSQIRHIYSSNSNATFITKISGSETALVDKLDANKKALKSSIDEQITGAFDPNKTTTTFSIEKIRRRVPQKNVTVDNKTMGAIVSELSPTETSDFLYHKHVIDSPTANLTDNVTAETYDAWFDSQNKSTQKFLKKQYREINKGTEAYDEMLKVSREKKSVTNMIEERRKELADLGPQTKPVTTISNLDYATRKRLAERVVMNHPDEYMLLYRVQNGKPDKWRPNNRGVAGKFEANGGEPGLKGAVWLTADDKWAEGRKRATAGVGANITDDNIVVLPVKKADILNLNQETSAKMELEKSGKKIVKTRGINNGLEESEYILWKNEHPEIFRDGMKAMLDEYNADNAIKNKRVIRRVQGGIDELETAMQDLEVRRKELSAIVNGNSYELLQKAIEYGGQDFQDSLKRAYLMGDEKFAKSSIANEAAKNIEAGKDAFYQGVVVANIKAKLKNVLNVDTDAFVDELYDSLRTNVNEFVRAILDNPASRDAINALADTVDGSEDVAKYLALQSLAKKSNLDKAKAAIKEQVKDAKKDVKGLLDEDVDLLQDKAAELFEDIVYTEFDNATLVAKTIDPDLVDSKDVYERVKEIRDRIEGAERRVGQDYIQFIDDNGQMAYAQVDPAFASLFNYRFKMERANAGVLVKVNAAMSKAFRYGTTSLSLSSFGNQLFRDFGNAIYVGGAWRTIQANADNLVDVFGQRIVDEIKQFEPDDFELRQIQRAAEETGQTVAEAAVSRELMKGAAKAPSSTERMLYKNFLKETYGQTPDDFLEASKTKIQQILKKWNPEDLLHGKRENYLRNRVYASALNDALEGGYTLQQARTFADFSMNNATTNFGRQIYHLQAIADSTPYFRAAINGTTSFWRMWTLDPVGITGRMMGGLIIPVMFFTGMSLADEKNREVYKNIPEYTKSESFIFVYDGHAMSIPLPQELAPIIAPFRQFVEHLYNTNKEDFWELMANDLLGFSPYDLTGFTAIDYDSMVSDPTIFDRISRGSARLFSQMAPVPVRSMYMIATGTDPYTGKSLRDPSYMYWNEETGSVEVMDYNSNAFAQWVATLFGGDVSPKLIERVVSGVLGNTGANVLGDLAKLVQEGPEAAFLSFGGNLVEQAINPITVNQYNLTDAIWKRAISQLTAEKQQILDSKKMDALNNALATEKDPGQRQKILSERQTLVDEFQQKVGDTIKRLDSVYHGTFDRKKFAAVIQLLNFNSDPVFQSGSMYSSTVASDQFWDGRDAAIHTMQQLGVTGTNDFSIFGYLAVDKQGNPIVKYTSPVAIMDMEAQWSNQNDVHLANIKALATQNKLWDKHDAMMNKVNAIYSKGKLSDDDYDAIDAIYVDWNAEVMSVLAPYIEEMTPEAAVNNNQVLDYLDGLIEVPGDFKKDKYGRYVTNSKLGNGSATQAYIKNYIKYIFGINDTAYSSGKNYSDRVNYNKETTSWK